MTKQTQTIPVLQNQVQAGLPSPAEDLGAERINLADLLQTDRQDTFFMRASGQSMVNVGIHDQDILVIRRSKRPKHGHIVAATVDGNNFYVSCERVFRASLNDTPVVVLSNNDLIDQFC